MSRSLETRSLKDPRKEVPKPETVAVGVVGLGLMGSSITACLLAAGHPVTGMDKSATVRRTIRKRLRSYLEEMGEEGLLKDPPGMVLKRWTLSEDYAAFSACELVVESTTEGLEIKRDIFRRLEEVISPLAIIGSNTSAIPVTQLQEGTARPERLLGIHWAEPAHITRFMEIICGQRTKLAYAEKVLALSHCWGKDPSLVRKDIRGFITNRVMYAMLREAFHLVETGVAAIEDVDRSVRNDLGSWITLAGPFRFMDLTGVPAYAAVMKDLFPELSNSDKIPKLMTELVQSGGKGVSNHKGFYKYTPAEAKRWEKIFLRFSYDIRKLSDKCRRAVEE